MRHLSFSRLLSRTRLFGFLGVVLILMVWIAAASALGTDIIPHPWTTVADTVRLLLQPASWAHFAITMARVLGGFACALVAGTFLGLASARRELETLLKPAILLIQGIPPILWTIPLILVLGFSQLTPILVIALICLPLVFLNVSEGTRSVPKELSEMLAVFSPGLLPRLRELVIPYLRPFFASALRLGLTLGIKASVVAEYFSANNGIGFQVQAAYHAFQVRRLFAWTLLLVLLILVFDRLLSRITTAARAARHKVPSTVLESCQPGEISDLRGRFTRKTSGVELELREVSFSYEGHRILDRCTLTVRPGTIAVISGDSGTGKTTLLKLTASILAPESGSVGRPSRIGFVFQDDRFLPWRTNVGNVSVPLVYDRIDRHSALCFSSFMMAEVGLRGRQLSFPEELSGGMKKRLALARCFAAMPEAILLDEPFSGLHRAARASLWGKFADLFDRHPAAVIIVTHYPEEVPDGLPCSFYTLSGAPARLFAV